MQISVLRFARWAALPACVISVLAAGPSSAEAKVPAVGLRVEAGSTTLASGQTYLTKRVGITTDARRPCSGSGKRQAVPGPSALSLLINAAELRPTLRPLGISDKFAFGLLVCRIGRSVASDSAFWLYKVNHVAPEVGADQRKVKAGDEVLWYFSNTATGSNTGDELALSGPARARSSRTFRVKVTAYDSAGKRTPAAGAQVTYGRRKVTTDTNGVAEVASGSGQLRLRATRGKDVASNSAAVCVAKVLSHCPPVTASVVNGTEGSDHIRGGKQPEIIKAYGGNDRIDVRGGGRDVVSCGRGVDHVILSRNDRASRDCEFVNGKKRSRRSASRG